MFVFQHSCRDEDISREELHMLATEVVSKVLSMIDRIVTERKAAEAMTAFLEEALSKTRKELQEAGRSQEESEDKGKMQLFMYYGLYLIL